MRSDDGGNDTAVSPLPSLSVILPTYNEAGWLPETLTHLREAVHRAAWSGVQIIVVDDGSTDETATVLAADSGQPPLTIVRQENGGRFRARASGLDAASGELVLFIDSRVHAHPESLRFVAGQLRDHPERRIWNPHVITAQGASVFTRFWDAITFLAWRRYLKAPSLTSYSGEDYDHFPKGTTYFLAPRSAMLDVAASFESSFGDLRHANDDTLMIRPLAEHNQIFISPEFSCTYHPRDSARKFLSHSFHRGTVFVDGYYRPGTRFYRPLQVILAALPLAIVLTVVWPKKMAVLVSLVCCGIPIGAKALGVPTRNALALGAVGPVFGLAYGSGILRGMAMRRFGHTRRAA